MGLPPPTRWSIFHLVGRLTRGGAIHGKRVFTKPLLRDGSVSQMNMNMFRYTLSPMLYPSPRIALSDAFEALKILTSRMSACNNMCQPVWALLDLTGLLVRWMRSVGHTAWVLKTWRTAFRRASSWRTLIKWSTEDQRTVRLSEKQTIKERGWVKMGTGGNVVTGADWDVSRGPRLYWTADRHQLHPTCW